MIRVWHWASCPARYKVFSCKGDEDWVIVTTGENQIAGKEMASKLGNDKYSHNVMDVSPEGPEHIFITCRV